MRGPGAALERKIRRGPLITKPEANRRRGYGPAKLRQSHTMGSGRFDRQGLVARIHGPAGDQIQPVETQHGLPIQLGRIGVRHQIQAGGLNVSPRLTQRHAEPLGNRLSGKSRARAGRQQLEGRQLPFAQLCIRATVSQGTAQPKQPRATPPQDCWWNAPDSRPDRSTSGAAHN